MDPEVAYHRVDDKGVLNMIDAVKAGIKFSAFTRLAEDSPFSLNEWAAFLQLSERTMHRYYQQKKTFDMSSSEKIDKCQNNFDKRQIWLSGCPSRQRRDCCLCCHCYN